MRISDWSSDVCSSDLATLESNTRDNQTVCGNGVEDVEQADHTFQRRGLKLPFGSNSSKALGRYFHSHNLQAGFNSLWRTEERREGKESGRQVERGVVDGK